MVDHERLRADLRHPPPVTTFAQKRLAYDCLVHIGVRPNKPITQIYQGDIDWTRWPTTWLYLTLPQRTAFMKEYAKRRLKD